MAPPSKSSGPTIRRPQPEAARPVPARARSGVTPVPQPLASSREDLALRSGGRARQGAPARKVAPARKPALPPSTPSVHEESRGSTALPPRPARRSIAPKSRLDTTPPRLQFVAESVPARAERAFDTAFFDTLGLIKALKVDDQPASEPRSLAEARGYRREDLFVIAQIARSYLFTGAHRLAVVLFDGLTAVAPAEPSFALGLGLALDRSGNEEAADAAYETASRLSPDDGRPDVNRAELALARGDRRSAMGLLQSARAKTRKRFDSSLARKVDAMISQLERGRQTAKKELR